MIVSSPVGECELTSGHILVVGDLLRLEGPGPHIPGPLASPGGGEVHPTQRRPA